AWLAAGVDPEQSIVSKDLQPLHIALLIEEARLAQHESLDFVHRPIHDFHVSNWCRIGSSLVPRETVAPSAWRWSTRTPRLISIHSLPGVARPRWQRSKISRSSEATSEAGDAARLTNWSVSSCISGGAPSSWKHTTSTTVWSTASGRTMRMTPKRALTEMFCQMRLLKRSTERTAAAFFSPWRSTSVWR